jgi:hypothetical protein
VLQLVGDVCRDVQAEFGLLVIAGVHVFLHILVLWRCDVLFAPLIDCSASILQGFRRFSIPESDKN